MGIDHPRHHQTVPHIQHCYAVWYRHLRSRSDSNDMLILNDNQSITHQRTLCAIEQTLRFDSPLHGMLLLTASPLALTSLGAIVVLDPCGCKRESGPRRTWTSWPKRSGRILPCASRSATIA